MQLTLTIFLGGGGHRIFSKINTVDIACDTQMMPKSVKSPDGGNWRTSCSKTVCPMMGRDQMCELYHQCFDADTTKLKDLFRKDVLWDL